MTDQTDLLDTSAHAFLDGVAAREATPGGGSVAAAAGALGAALARMVVAYSTGTPSQGSDPAAVRQAAEQLARSDRMLRQLVNEDAAAYRSYTEARRSSDPAAKARADGLAIAVPMETAAVASAALRLLDEIKTTLNLRLVSDLGTAAVLAEASVQAAAYHVRINLRGSEGVDPSGEVRKEMEELLEHARVARKSIVAWVESHLQG